MAERMNELTGKEWLQLSFSVWRDVAKDSEERALKHPAAFPRMLVDKLLKIYLKGKNKLVMDPFLGIGTTLLAAKAAGHDGVGFDLNKDYLAIAEGRISAELESHPTTFKIYNADSRNLLDHVEPNSVDLVVTSPPYWDILNQKRTADKRDIKGYSEDKEDLGNIEDYEEFLQNLKEVFSAVYVAMKPNSRCVSVVMDLRKKDKFFPLHEDQTRIMKEIGFELEEYVIWDRQRDYNNMKTLGYPWVFRFNKVHEFVCVYWKREQPQPKRKGGKKASTENGSEGLAPA
jgi:DNA modification methylase